MATTQDGSAAGGGRSAILVGTGILLSRIAGLARSTVLAHFLGSSDAADAFNAAFRIPNVLQNLFGEGVLSASFIPVYARLVARGDDKEASRVASAVLSLLALAASVLVLVGVLATPWLIGAIAPGFDGAKRELTVRLVRILFPGAGLLVLSAWCLGVLNSHRRFLLSYTAPVAWNLAIIVALLARGGTLEPERLVVVAAWASVAGSALQIGVQLPLVLRLAGSLRPALGLSSGSVRTVVRNFVPVVTGRGVVQLSAYIDVWLASLVASGAVAALSYAQVLYTLPVSLFGMAMSAAALPAMAVEAGGAEGAHEALRVRLDAGLARLAFFIVPSSVAFLALGDVLAAALFQSGRFTHADALWVWGILAGSAVGLLASTMGRLYSSAYYALQDTRTPLKYALVRVALTMGLGYLFAIPLPAALGIDPRWGVAGLTASAGIAGWVEFVMLRRGMGRRIGATGIAARRLARLWASALGAAAVAWGVRLALPELRPVLFAIPVVAAYGATYFALAAALGVPQSREILARVGTGGRKPARPRPS